MSLLGPRSSSISRDDTTRRDVARELPRATESLAFEVRWTWSRRAASRALGLECRRDLELLLAVELWISASSSGVPAPADGCGRWQLLAGEEAIDLPAGAPAAECALRGTVLDTAAFRHLDLADDQGIFLRASLPTRLAATSPVWSRLPGELGVAGGCLSAPELSIVGAPLREAQASPAHLVRGLSPNGEGSLRSAFR